MATVFAVRSMRLTLVALAVMAVGAGVIIYARRGSDVVATNVTGEASARPSDVVPIDSKMILENKKKAIYSFKFDPTYGGDVASRHVTSHPFPEIPKTREGLSMEDDPFGPHSPAEQQWLDRNGYPNAAQWTEYQQVSDALLEQAANAGDKVAETFLNIRKLQGGDGEMEGALLYAGAMGNAFALEMLSSVLSGPGPLNDPLDGYAFSRVAEMRGNLSIGFARELFSPNRLNQQQKAEAEVRALQYFNLLWEVQKETLGATASPVDPRPVGGG